MTIAFIHMSIHISVHTSIYPLINIISFVSQMLFIIDLSNHLCVQSLYAIVQLLTNQPFNPYSSVYSFICLFIHQFIHIYMYIYICQFKCQITQYSNHCIFSSTIVLQMKFTFSEDLRLLVMKLEETYPCTITVLCP